jgi:flagellar biosynthesis/type III secretory pathway chaperone
VSRPLLPFADPASATLSQLLRCLQDEADALVGADVDKLAQAVREKESALRRLADELGRADRSALREAVLRARDLNERNARLLAPHFHVNRARIDSLLGAARSMAVYSADGHAAGAERRPAQRGVRA